MSVCGFGRTGGYEKEACWVDANNEEGAKEAVLHLAGEGFERIAFLLENRNTVFAENVLPVIWKESELPGWKKIRIS